MNVHQDFDRFIKSENSQERGQAIANLAKDAASWQRDILIWKFLGSLPTHVEKARLGHELTLSKRPSSDWVVASYLSNDTDQDVAGNAINSMTLSNTRALSHRVVHFFSSTERPQRILYCLARYAEETNDIRFAKHLAPHLTNELSDAFLARSFNSLFRLGVKDDVAIKVASELVASHIDATNMDRKAAVSAIVYLFFAASKDVIQGLAKVRDKVTIPELRRLINWGFATIHRFEKGNFSADEASVFFEIATNEEEPNFSGYGCFKIENLKDGLKKFLDAQPASSWQAVTKTVLALGEMSCIDLLAEHKQFGISAAISKKEDCVLEAWRKFLPLHSAKFLASIHNPEHYNHWHSKDPSALFTILSVEDFIDSGKAGKWQIALTNKMKSGDLEAALDLICAQALAIERSRKTLSAANSCQIVEAFFLKNVEEIYSAAKSDKAVTPALISDRIHGVVLGGHHDAGFLTKLLSCVSFEGAQWAVNAAMMTTSQKDPKVFSQIFEKEIGYLTASLQKQDIAPEDFMHLVTSRCMALICGIEFCENKINEDALGKFRDFCQSAQGIFDVAENTKPAGASEDDSDEDVPDWSGQVTRERPISRWESIYEVCASTTAEKTHLESVLLAGMRTSPHVDKRWIVRSLVKLGTDDAVKAILYQAFQHVDPDFVALTIKELLPSKHPRAQQALIRCVGRNSVSDDLKFLILDEISLDNPKEILRELRTLEVLRLPQHIDEAIKDAAGRVSALIDTSDVIEPAPQTSSRVSSPEIDSTIKKLLPNADQLSVDVRSALRTAEMIFVQSQDWGVEAVDLSPIVNMHCKAVELTLREVFEPYTDSLIRKGILSRKLDILGYARPIPEKMQLFEDYLGNLPIIKTIPYFSKFKLRKMLRAVCLYRPGRRFTLDGPKAFALLFLVVGRKQCQMGLDRLMDLGFESDQALYEFIKLVHSLQDSRNRAVHEGLTWEAKDEIDSMRNQAYKIIEQCLKMGSTLQKSSGLLVSQMGA